jgi:hypothetical protein
MAVFLVWQWALVLGSLPIRVVPHLYKKEGSECTGCSHFQPTGKRHGVAYSGRRWIVLGQTPHSISKKSTTNKHASSAGYGLVWMSYCFPAPGHNTFQGFVHGCITPF